MDAWRMRPVTPITVTTGCVPDADFRATSVSATPCVVEQPQSETKTAHSAESRLADIPAESSAMAKP